MSLNVYLLGQFKVLVGDVPLEIPSRAAQSLLAYLVINAGVTQRREKLATLLWPETSESNARSYLRQALWRIRKALEYGSLDWEEYLQVNDISITFSEQSDYWLDAEHLLGSVEGRSIEELSEVLRLYRGELLPGFYDEWIVLERDRFQAAYEQKMDRLLSYLIQAAKWDEVLRWAEQWIRQGYAPEPAFRGLMIAHAGQGNQGMISATYQRCVESLNRELGVDPSPETRRLYEQMLSGEWAGFVLHPAQDTIPAEQRPTFLEEGSTYRIEKPIFVARERELAKLDEYLSLALAGQGRVVFVTGEAGSGKTALIQEFTRRALEAHADLIVASGNCNAHTGIGDPYLPFREILEQLTGDVEARCAAGAISREHAQRIWRMLPVAAQAVVESGPDLIDTFVPGVPLVERVTACGLGGVDWLTRLKVLVERRAKDLVVPGPQQRALHEQYTRVVQALAREGSLVLVLDDLQWADLSSVNLLFHLGRNLAGSRILILGAYRPEDIGLGREGERHPLEAVINELQREFGEISVNMDQAESRAFVDAFLDSEPNRLGVEFREMLCRQTRGHPLFTIELLRGLQERGDLVKDLEGCWVEGQELEWETLPARVDAVVAERISRLAQPLQAALRVASVEGETFTAEVVARALETDERDLISRMSSELDKKHRLISAHSVQRIDGQLLSFYRFRHVLSQKYLYSSLDEVERVHLHERVGLNLEALYGAQENASGGDVAAIAPQLARHFQEARITAKAIQYLRQSGELAVQLSAYQEAIAHLTKGLALLLAQPDSPERARRELQLQLAMGIAWGGNKDYAHIEVKKTYTRARELCQKIEGEKSRLCQILGELSLYHYVRAEYREAHELGEEALLEAQRTQDPLLEVLSRWYLGVVLFSLGEYVKAREHLEQVIDYYDPIQHHRPFVLLRGSDMGLSALAYSACCLWCLGYPERASERSEIALGLAHEFRHSFSLVDVLCYGGCMFNQIRRDAAALKENAEELSRVADQAALRGWMVISKCFLGAALVRSGEVEKGIAQIREGIAENQALGTILYMPVFLNSIAEAQAKAGQLEEGMSTLASALAMVEQTDERFWEAELYRLRAELLLMRGDEAAAEASLVKAIEVARRQNAKSWELRAATSLARLWQKQGKGAEARQLLGEIYGWFTEGYDTRDLAEARELLEELAG